MHKDAIVIAVPSGSGELVMEAIVESKASSLLQFIHGLCCGMQTEEWSLTMLSIANCNLTISSAKPPISDSKSSKLPHRSFWRAKMTAMPISMEHGAHKSRWMIGME